MKKTKEEIEALAEAHANKMHNKEYAGLSWQRSKDYYIESVTSFLENEQDDEFINGYLTHLKGIRKPKSLESQQDNKPVDVEKLKQSFIDTFKVWQKLTLDEIFEWLKPFLSNTSEDKEAFAVGFAEWCGYNYDIFIDKGKSVWSKNGHFSTVELLKLYKDSLPQPPKQD